MQTQTKHGNHEISEQYKNIFTLEDKLKKIQQRSTKDRKKKKVKINVAKNEDILIEIDPNYLVILDNTTTADDQNKADTLDQNYANNNNNYESEEEEQNLFEDYLSQKRQQRNNKT